MPDRSRAPRSPLVSLPSFTLLLGERNSSDSLPLRDRGKTRGPATRGGLRLAWENVETPREARRGRRSFLSLPFFPSLPPSFFLPS